MVDNVKQQGVRLQEPRSIAYHPTKDCLLVCDYDSQCVRFLHPTNLCEMTKVKIPGISRPAGVYVMSDGNIVVSGDREFEKVDNSGSVGVFDVHDKQLHMWDNKSPGCCIGIECVDVAVDHKDNILVLIS